MNVISTKDRIQVSTLCLFICSVVYVVLVWQFFQLDAQGRGIGIALGLYTLLVYASLAVLAIGLKRWAWMAVNAAFGIHLAAAVLVAQEALPRGISGILALAVWIGVAALGLWANLRPASKAAVSSGRSA